MDLNKDISILLEEFDRSLLPVEQQNLEGIDFRFAVVDYLKAKYRDLGHHVEVRADLHKVVISPQANESNIVKAFNDGILQYGIDLCDERLRQNPDDGVALYNSGIALSNLNQLDKAIDRLTHLLEVDGDIPNVLVALGVAYGRQENYQKAIEAFKAALNQEPSNSYALSNLARSLFLKGEREQALTIYSNLAPKEPQDASLQLGYAEALKDAGHFEAANRVYDHVIRIAPASAQAVKAKEGKTAISNSLNAQRKEKEGGVRMDAVMYLQHAMKTYDNLTEDEGRNLFFEVALAGRNGFDTQDATRKYSLKAIPDTHYSGFQLVCMMYAGTMRFLPEVDEGSLGIDLKEEYQLALQTLSE